MRNAIESGAIPPILYQEPRWYACYTHGRHEKRVAARFEQIGIESFLPLRTEKRKWSDRSRQVQIPLFPSYVFARFTLSTLGLVLDIPGLATVVRLRGHPTPIPDAEMQQTRELVNRAHAHQVELETTPEVMTGERVRITGGIFEGIEGVVLEAGGKTHVHISLGVIQQGIKVAVPKYLLERINFFSL